MKVIQRPAGSAITACNVPELPPPAWAAGTAYALGDQVSVMGGPSNTTADVYESRIDGNLGNTPASSPDAWQAIVTAYAAHTPALAYATSAMVTGSDHMTYIALQSMASGRALSDRNYWALIGPSARQRMLDGLSSTQTARPDKLTVTFDIAGRVDTLALINVNAATVAVRMDATAGTVFDRTYSMTSDVGIIDWYAWLFEEIVRKTDLLIEGLPFNANPALTIEAVDPGEAAIGHVDFGVAKEIGATQYGLRLGSTDYSKVNFDEFGGWSRTMRGWAKRMSLTAWIDAERTDETYALLNSLLSTPVTVIGAAKYGATLQSGFFREWAIEIPYPSHSIISIDFQGT